MSEVVPKVFIIADTTIKRDGMDGMLEHLGVPKWKSDAASDHEELIEASGKMCYMSFDTSLNLNLTTANARTNEKYIQDGIISVGHGSVLEHASVTFAFLDVSRVLTHELVRHRVGAAYSQTSGRYVRTDRIDMFVPSVIRDDPYLLEIFQEAIENMQGVQARLTVAAGINEMVSRGAFELKKKLTSAFRRLIGNGQANNIIATFNHRTIRHLIETRTSRHAEEEIRLAFNQVFELVSVRYKSIYADANLCMVDGHNEIVFSKSKV